MALKTEKVEKFEIIRAELGGDTEVGGRSKKSKKGKGKAKSKGRKEESDGSLKNFIDDDSNDEIEAKKPKAKKSRK